VETIAEVAGASIGSRADCRSRKRYPFSKWNS